MRESYLHLSTVHPRDDIRIFHKMCQSLSSCFEVSLACADGLGSKDYGDVRVIDVGRPSGRLSRMLITSFRVLAVVREVKPSVIHFHDPELIFSAMLLRALGATVIYDVHEDVPRQILSKPWVPLLFRKPIAWLFERFENFAASKMSAVITATETIGDRFSCVSNSVAVICNYPILSEFNVVVPSRGERTLCYVGGVSRARGIVELVKALEYLPDYTLILAGKFHSLSLQVELESMPGWKQVDYRGVVGRCEVIAILSASSIGVVTLLPIENYLDSLPIKMFEYMAAGLPVLASDFPLWKNLIEDEGCGVCVNPEDPQAIARVILMMTTNKSSLCHMGDRGKKLVQAKYNWDVQFELLVKLHREMGVLKDNQ